jgi:DNA-binding PadR family transcriptional regulator
MVLAVLLDAGSEWSHGYELARLANVKSGTLYPLLIRLEAQGYLEAEWQQPTEGGRPPRHAYRLTASGVQLARANSQVTPRRLPKTPGGDDMRAGLRRGLADLVCRTASHAAPSLHSWGWAVRCETADIPDDTKALLFALDSACGLMPRAVASRLLQPFASPTGEGAPLSKDRSP